MVGFPWRSPTDDASTRPEASPATTRGSTVDSVRTIGARVFDRVGDQRGRPARVGGQAEGGLVEVGDERHVGDRGAVGDRVGETRWRGRELGGDLLGDRGVVALVGLVVLDQHVARAHQRRHRCERVPVHGPVLERGVHRLQEVGGGDRAHDLLLVGHERTGHQTGIDGVDGVAPPVGGEVVAGHRVDTGPRVARVERGGRLVDVAGRRGRLGETVRDDRAGPERRRRGDDRRSREQPDHEAHPPGARGRPR